MSNQLKQPNQEQPHTRAVQKVQRKLELQEKAYSIICENVCAKKAHISTSILNEREAILLIPFFHECFEVSSHMQTNVA